MRKEMRMALIVAGLSVLPGCSGGKNSQLPPTDTFPSFYGEVPQNLIVVSVDTFRIDHLKRYGDTRKLTPFLDQLLAEGVTLDQHRSCANWTYPGSQCAMDAYDALDLGFIPRFDRAPLPDRGTGATAYGSAGYYTVLVTSNGWLHDEEADEYTNLSYGFDYARHPGTDNAVKIYELARDQLLDAVREDKDPWMMHIHLKEPHTPYNPPESYLDGLEDLPPLDYDLTDFDQHYDATAEWPELTEEEQALLYQHLTLRYAGEIAYLNNQLALIWADMEERGLLDDALVVLWSDHGEQFFEHGRQAHALALYSEENSALGAFWAKNIVPATVELPTTHADLLATAMDVMGIPAHPEVTGTPLSQLAEVRPIHSYTVARLGAVQSLVMEDHKLLYTWMTGEKELYSLTNDPAEQVNLYDPADPLVIQMWDELLPRYERMSDILDYGGESPGP